ncbi:MAG: hypothetical protein NZ585_13280 [Chloracidobacterium sp.]|nr:hypothetical protein [Chloracidobacterium sp.]MDW8218537.1 7TM-DISM domain-containing protein [Acidobacteriota bacterium]
MLHHRYAGSGVGRTRSARVEYVKFLADPARSLTIDHVVASEMAAQFIRSLCRTANFGFTRAAH